MNEIIAILFERLAGKDFYDEEPHKTANDIVDRLEEQRIKLNEIRGEIKFSEVLRFALQYNNHKNFENALNLLEKTYQ